MLWYNHALPYLLTDGSLSASTLSMVNRVAFKASRRATGLKVSDHFFNSHWNIHNIDFVPLTFRLLDCFEKCVNDPRYYCSARAPSQHSLFRFKSYWKNSNALLEGFDDF